MQRNIVFIVLAIVFCTALAEHTRVKRRMYAMCPPNFKRIGSECYFISSSRLNWLDAHFECKDKNSKLAEPGKSADRKLRTFLLAMDTDPDEIWIGGAYDWNSYKWHWGYNGKEITYQSFSQIDPGWSARSCVDRHRFICQHKMPKVSDRNRVKVYNRWNETYPNQLANEVLLEIVDSGENGTRRRAIVKIDNDTYAVVDCKIRRVTHRRVKAVGTTDTFTIPIKHRQNSVRRRRKRPVEVNEGYLGTEQYSTPGSLYTNDIGVLNGQIGAHDIKDPVAQFVPDSNGFKTLPVKDDEILTTQNGRVRGGRGRQRQNKPTNNPNIETNETIQRPKPNKPRQRTEFDREIELKRRRELQRKRKQEQHRRWKQEQREKAKKENEEAERLRQIEEQERLRQAEERETEQRKRMAEQKEQKRKQMEELEDLKQQQLEELERERQQAELAQKRRHEIQQQQKESRERQEQIDVERLEKERQNEENKRLEAENERLNRQKEYQEEVERKRKKEQHRIILESEETEKAKEQEHIRQLEEQRRLQAKEVEERKREEEYKKLEEERQQIEREREEAELARLEEEEKRRVERQKVRDDEIRMREELLRQQEDEEKRLQDEIKEREEAERIAREEDQIRKEQEKKQKEEEEKRKQAELEEKRRQKELRRQKAESEDRADEEEQKRIKMQKLRERLAKLSPEDQKKFFEMRKQRKKKHTNLDNEANESIIPE